MRLPYRLDQVIERSNQLAEVERLVLRKLAGIDLPSSEARSAWSRIRDHKWYLSERMGRHVGMRVAAID